MRHDIERSLFAAGAAVLLAAAASAQDILNQPPTQAYSFTTSLNFNSAADNFVAPAGGVTIAEVTWWGGWGPSGTPNADTFDIYILGSTTSPFGNQEPSAVIFASYLDVSPTVTATGTTMPNNPAPPIAEQVLVFQVPGSGAALAAGEYWVEIFSSDDSGSTDKFLWGFSDQDPVNGAPCWAFSSSTPGLNWSECPPAPADDLALRLSSPADLGANYCIATANSTGSPAIMSVSGSLSILDANVVLEASPVPNDFFVFYMGPNQINTPFGNGTRCVGGTATRIWPPGAASGNLATRSVDMGALGIAPGTWNVQCWFRDPGAGMSGFDLSDGSEIVLQP